jgi:hypothetical protein
MDEVLDVAELDAGMEEVESGAEQIEEGSEEVAESQQQEPANADDPYTTKYSREMRAALKAWEQANPESAKYAKQARDNHARLFALQQLEPKGIEGVREKYALLDGLTHGDAKGAEALTALREEYQGVLEIDEKIAAGDPSALEAFGEDFNPGLAKLAPAILDRVLKSDPAAFDSIVLPHLVSTLAESTLVREFNALIDVLNAQNDPRFDDKTKASFTRQQLAKMGAWLNEVSQKAGTVKAAVAPNGKTADPLVERQTTLEKQEQEFHWNTKIAPTASSHENATFKTLFDPYQKRLKLDAPAQADLMQAFKAGLNRAGSGDADYMRQMKLYRAQKNPDPAMVGNYVKSAINKHAKSVMESLIKARYGRFLTAKPTVGNVTSKNGKPQSPAGPGVEIRTVKPPMNEIDHRNTPVEWLAQKKYRLTSGKVIQVRPVQ